MGKRELIFKVLLVVCVGMAMCGAPIVAQPPLQVKWACLGMEGSDMGVGAEGDTYVAGVDGKLYMHNFRTNTFEVVEGDFEMAQIDHVDVDADGTAYVVTRCGGQVYYLDPNNNWVKLPGCASDIGVGRGGEIWKIGCDARLGGFGVWKLFCKCKCKCNCTRQVTRFRQTKYRTNVAAEVKSCFWYRIEGGGVRVDVDPNGQPWIVSDNHSVYMYDGVNWRLVDGFSAEDITISNDGIVFAAGSENNIGRLVCPDLGTWQILHGAAKRISAGPFNLPFIADGTNKLYTSATWDFN